MRTRMNVYFPPDLLRQIIDLARTVSTETLALFIRFWLTVTPPLPAHAQAVSQVKGRERYESFVEALGRRLANGATLSQEIPNDVISSEPRDNDKHRERTPNV